MGGLMESQEAGGRSQEALENEAGKAGLPAGVRERTMRVQL